MPSTASPSPLDSPHRRHLRRYPGHHEPSSLPSSPADNHQHHLTTLSTTSPPPLHIRQPPDPPSSPPRCRHHHDATRHPHSHAPPRVRLDV
ncbi:hypothetical protein Tco_0957701 [Tanacetum coccineum]